MASYYWIGTGGGTWDSSTTTNWASSSGGAGGAGVPGSADTAIFDGNSGSNTITTSGSLTITALTLNTAFAGAVTFGASFTVSGIVTFIQGTLNTNGQTCNWGSLTSSGSATRVLTLGSSAITISGAAGWVYGTTGCSVTTNTATITITGASAAINLGSINYNGTSIVINSTGTVSWSAAATVAALTYAPTSGASNILLVGIVTVTVTGTLTLTGSSSAGARILVQTSGLGSAATFSASTVTATYCDFQDITGTGSASWNLSAITGLSGDCGGNSGMTLTTAATQYYVGGTASWVTASSWASSSGGTAGSGRIPLPQDPAVFDVHSFPSTGQTLTLNSGTRICASLSFTGVINSPTISIGIAPIIFGSLTLIAGLTFSAAHSYTLAGRGSYTITNAGQSSYLLNLGISAPGGTYTLQDALTISSGFIITAGTFDNSVNNVAISTGTFSSSGSTTTRAYKMGTNTLTLTASGATWSTNSTSSLTVSTSTVAFTATSGTSTVVTGGATMPNIVVNGAGGTVKFSDSTTTAGTVTLTAGTLNTNGQTCSWGTFINTSTSTRTLTLGASAITITANVSGEAWQGGSTGLTVTANTAIVTFTVQNVTCSMSSVNYNGMSVVITSSFSPTYTGTGHTVANFTYNPSTTQTSNFLTVGSAFTVTGTITFTGAAAPNIPLVGSGTLGVARIITCNGTATLTSRMDFEDVTGAGSATWNFATGGGDCLGNSGITLATPQTNYWVGNTGNWATTTAWASSSGGSTSSGRVPLPQDSVVFDANSFTATGKTVTTDCLRLGVSVSWAAVTNSPTWAATQNVVVYGSLTLTSGMTRGSFLNLTFSGRTTSTVTTAGLTMPTTTINAPSGTLRFNDNFSTSTSGILTVTTGTLDAATNNVNVSVGQFELTGTLTRQVTMGSGTWTLSGSNGHVCDVVTSGLTLNAGTSTVYVSDTGSNNKIIAMGGTACNFYNLQIASGGTGLVIFGNSSQNWNSITCNGPKNIEFTSGTTNTIASAAGWKVNGNSGSLVVITATTSGTAATVSIASGVVVSQYVSLKDSTVTGGATFYAANSTNVSNNTGWSFSNPSPIGQNMMGGMGA